MLGSTDLHHTSAACLRLMITCHNIEIEGATRILKHLPFSLCFVTALAS